MLRHSVAVETIVGTKWRQSFFCITIESQTISEQNEALPNIWKIMFDKG